MLLQKVRLGLRKPRFFVGIITSILIVSSFSTLAPSVRADTNGTPIDVTAPTSCQSLLAGSYTNPQSGIGQIAADGRGAAVCSWSLSNLSGAEHIRLSFEMNSSVPTPGPFGPRVTAFLGFATLAPFRIDPDLSATFPNSTKTTTTTVDCCFLPAFLAFESELWINPDAPLSGDRTQKICEQQYPGYADDNVFHSYSIDMDIVSQTTTWTADGGAAGASCSGFAFLPTQVVFYARSTDDGNFMVAQIRNITLSTAGGSVNVRITTDVSNEPSVAIDPTNPNRVVAAANDYDHISQARYFISTNGGQSFDRAGSLNFAKSFFSDPVLGFDPSGNAYFAGLNVTNTNGVCTLVTGLCLFASVFVSKMPASSDTFGPPKIIAHGSLTFRTSLGLFTSVTEFQNVFYDKPAMFVSPTAGNVYVTFTQFDRHVQLRLGLSAGIVDFTRIQVLMSSSVDGGKTFSSPVPVSESARCTSFLPGTLLSCSPAFGSSVQGSAVVASNTGIVYVSWLHDTPLGSEIQIANSTAGFKPVHVANVNPIDGISYGGPLNFARLNSFPALALTNDGKLMVTWANNEGGQFRVVLASSIDMVNWSQQIVGNVASGNSCFLPALTASEARNVVAFECMNKVTGDINLFVSKSADNFSTQTQMTSAASHLADAVNCLCQPALGDYIALASQGSIAQVAWGDTRDGRVEVWTIRFSL